MLEVTIGYKEANQKVFKFVKKYLNNAPLSLIYKIFSTNEIQLKTMEEKQLWNEFIIFVL